MIHDNERKAFLMGAHAMRAACADALDTAADLGETLPLAVAMIRRMPLPAFKPDALSSVQVAQTLGPKE